MEKICCVCDKTFKVKPSHYNKRFCCSKQCKNINQKNKIGILNNNYKGGIKTQKCNYCNNLFISKNPYSKRKYCSRKCSTDYNIGKKKILHINTLKYIELKKTNGLNNPKKKCICGNKKDIKSKQCVICFRNNIKRKNKTCNYCNNLFTPKHNILKYCSKICFVNYKKEFNKSSNNPNWKGGITNENKKERQSDKYKEWRISVFVRDNYTCQHCKIIGGILHSHHIKHFSKNKDLRFDINNGLTLCFNCHKKLHNNMNFKKITI